METSFSPRPADALFGAEEESLKLLRKITVRSGASALMNTKVWGEKLNETC